MANIFVGNLSYQTTEEQIRDLFAEYGTVDRVNIITDRMTGRPRGFAFVEMPDSAAAKAAIEALNGAELEGRALTVNEARPRAERGGGGGGGGGGGRRARYGGSR
jgi:cold-inducible RNA-binding protein